MKISAVIITYNEERNIERCLKSLQGIADEIVVLDSFSEDKTPQICKAFGVNFFSREWQGYSKSKNYANSLAAHDFILSVDADEALSNRLRESILHLKENDHKSKAFSVNRLTNYCGKWIRHSGWYPDRKIRIFNRKEAGWQGEIHEKPVFNQKVSIHHLQGDLLHYSFYTVDEHISQINKFSSIYANQQLNKKQAAVLIKMIFNPAFRFLRDYLFRGGILDGVHGYIICRNNAYANYLRYAKSLQLILQKREDNQETIGGEKF